MPQLDGQSTVRRYVYENYTYTYKENCSEYSKSRKRSTRNDSVQGTSHINYWRRIKRRKKEQIFPKYQSINLKSEEAEQEFTGPKLKKSRKVSKEYLEKQREVLWKVRIETSIQVKEEIYKFWKVKNDTYRERKRKQRNKNKNKRTPRIQDHSDEILQQ